MTHLKNQKGVSLISVMAAVAIFAIVLTGYLNLTGYTRKAEMNNNFETTATILAEQKLNYYRIHNLPSTNPFSEILNGKTYNVRVQIVDFKENPVYQTGSESHSVSLQTVKLVTGNPKLLTVTVSWSES